MKKNIFISCVVCAALIVALFFLHKNDTDSVGSRYDQQQAVKSAEDAKIEEYQNLYSLTEGKNNDELLLDAKSAIIIDAETGEVIAEKNPHEKLPPASITKILTAIVALENLNLDQEITVSERAAATEPNKIVMKAGEKLTVRDLLYGLTMISANDAAEVLAEGIDSNRETFLAKMAKKVKLLGLTDTNFKNPSGLDEENHYSSAYDIAKITYYGLKTQSTLINYLGYNEAYSIYPTTVNESHWWAGHISATLAAYPEMIGAKTGYTEEAGNTFIGIAQRDNRKIIFVFLGSQQANEDAKNLLYYGLNHKSE